MENLHKMVIDLEECILNLNYWGLYTKNGYRKEVFENASSHLRYLVNNLIEAIQFSYGARINNTNDKLNFFKYRESYLTDLLNEIEATNLPPLVSDKLSEIRVFLMESIIKLG